jgi:hypothetical protein
MFIKFSVAVPLIVVEVTGREKEKGRKDSK